MKRSPAILTALAIGLVLIPVQSASAGAAAHEFRNCTDMHHTYPHGVGRVHAHDKTSGTPVTTFKRSNALYRANKKSDRDHDGIACEKR